MRRVARRLGFAAIEPRSIDLPTPADAAATNVICGEFDGVHVVLFDAGDQTCGVLPYDASTVVPENDLLAWVRRRSGATLVEKRGDFLLVAGPREPASLWPAIVHLLVGLDARLRRED